MLAMLPGFDDRVMTVVTPAEVASRAATILVDMPPVPRLEPELDTVFGLDFRLFVKDRAHTICLQSRNIVYYFDGLGIEMRSRILVI